MTDFIPFALPDIGEEEICEVVDSMRSGWLTTGVKTKRFEEEFVDALGGGLEAVAVNSATAGLHLAMEAIGIRAGDEVITTPYTFTSTAEVIRYMGAHPVFVDIDRNTFCIDPAKMEMAITPKTKAIVPVHIAGLPCDMHAILDIAKRHGLHVIEDAAHALPSIYRGNLIGTLGSDATVFSFYATKTITTGEGGMLVTKNAAIARRCRTMRLHGISRDVFDRYTSTKPSWQYDVVAPGYKYNLTDIASSIGIHQLKKMRLFQEKRQAMAKLYDAAFGELPVLLPPRAPENCGHAWHLYILRLLPEAPVSRDIFIEKMAEKGIGCSVHFIPLHIQPYWREKYCLQPEELPCALHNYECAVSLPLYTKMTADAQSRVIEAVKDVLQGC